jgi:uncharacterized protein (TIGR03067 family)
MSRIVCLLASVLLIAPSLGSDEPRGYDDAMLREDELQGDWHTADHEWDLTLRGGKWVANLNGFAGVGTYTTDAGRRPAHLDFGGIKYIYQVEGDTLRIAWMPERGDRPRNFDAAGVVVTTYMRTTK